MAVMLSGESTIYHYYNAEKGLDNTASLKLENSTGSALPEQG
jgi:hypothetical protein